MIIVNADDFGRSKSETDVVVRCYERGSLTSTTAMMFMADSERAADVARTVPIDVGLHLNFSQRFTGAVASQRLLDAHDRIVTFLTRSPYSLLLYHPGLRKQFEYVFQAQLEEFVRLYGRAPSHIDGHQHKHLCTNMVVDRIIPAGVKVRRNFSFWPGEKSGFNRTYRRVIDRSLARRHKMPDFFFALERCLVYGRTPRVFDLARTSVVELMTHPANPREYDYLVSDECRDSLARVAAGTYAAL